jgi:hypothetical protein
MTDVVTIWPVGHNPGLIAYECSFCGFVDSEFLFPQKRPN